MIRSPRTPAAERGASTMEYVIMIVILSLVVGGAVITYRNKAAEKAGQAGASVERMEVQALDGNDVGTRRSASPQWRPTGDGESLGGSSGIFTNKIAGYAIVAVLIVAAVGATFMRRRKELAQEVEDDKTPPSGVRAIGADKPPDGG